MLLADLPPELKARIFKHVVARNHKNGYQKHQPNSLRQGVQLKPGCRALCLVCSEWYRIVSSDARMKVQYVIIDSTNLGVPVQNSSPSPTTGKECESASQADAECDLVVFFAPTWDSRFLNTVTSDRSLQPLAPSTAARRTLDDSLLFISSNSRRLTFLSLMFDNTGWKLDLTIRLLASHSFPRLWYFACQLLGEGDTSDALRVLAGALEGEECMPLLEVMGLYTIPPLGRNVFTFYSKSMTSLGITLAGGRGDAREVEIDPAVLMSLPDLETLAINDVQGVLALAPMATSGSAQPYVLKKLVSCELRWPVWLLWGFLSGLDAPRLRSLNLKIERIDLAPHPSEVQQLLRLADLSHIEHLTMEPLCDDTILFLETVQLPRLAHLSLPTGFRTQQYTCPEDLTRFYFPTLVTLDLHLLPPQVNWILRCLFHPGSPEKWPRIKTLTLNGQSLTPHSCVDNVPHGSLESVQTLRVDNIPSRAVLCTLLPLIPNIHTLIARSPNVSLGEYVREQIHPRVLPHLRRVFFVGVQRPVELIQLAEAYAEDGRRWEEVRLRNMTFTQELMGQLVRCVGAVDKYVED